MIDWRLTPRRRASQGQQLAAQFHFCVVDFAGESLARASGEQLMRPLSEAMGISATARICAVLGERRVSDLRQCSGRICE